MEQSWAALVPILGDGVVRLRAHTEADLTGLTSMCQDPEMARWTTVPQPYAPSDARYYFDEVIAPGWLHNNQWSWALEAELDGEPRFAGNIDLRLDGLGGAEVGFATHPDARGLGLMTRALRLVADHALTQGLTVVRWRALVGNWGSRKIAMRCGFHFEGTLRRLLPGRPPCLVSLPAACLRSVWSPPARRRPPNCRSPSPPTSLARLTPSPPASPRRRVIR